MKPQSRDVLELLRRTRGGITPAEARAAIGTDRLAARIFELRDAGYDIDRVMERAPDGATYARYYLNETRQMAFFDALPGGGPVLPDRALPPAGRRQVAAAVSDR